MEHTQIDVRYEGEIAIITLNRPEKLNAWTPTMAAEQARAIADANAAPSIGAIVMTGAGRGFCAGADMSATFATRMADADAPQGAPRAQTGIPADVDWIGLLRESKPVVCAVNGAAIGIGITMCLPSDQIVASTEARIALNFVKLGLLPELASSRLLAARVGVGMASDLLLSGRTISGTEAHQIGLADQLAEPDDVLARALGVARSYAANPDGALRLTKQLLTMHATGPDLALVQQRERELQRQCLASPEHAEAVRAFLDKRPPVFRPTR